MEDVVAGAIVGAAAQAVIDKLSSLFSLKFDQVEEFKGDTEKLKSNFEWIQAERIPSHLKVRTCREATLDDAGMQHITSRVIKLWLRKLEDMSDEAYHALDEFHYHLLRQMRKNMEMEAQTSLSLMRKTKSIFSGSYSNDPRQILGRKVKDINERLDSLLNQESKYLGIHQMILGSVNNTPAVVFASPETDSFTVDPVFIGREEDVSKIVEMLANIPMEGDLSILPVVGMGGLGKTTLARKVFHHETISARFPTLIWVHVSTIFDTNTLFKKILENLIKKSVKGNNREVVLTNLKEALAGNTFLLVLDDMWNKDRRMWEDFINPLSTICSTKGNGIIVTTRNSEVGSIVGTLPIHELHGITEEGCWSIIKAKSFGDRETPLEFQVIGENIAKRCQGLPLAANVVGGLLCCKSKDDWVSIEQNWLSDFDGNDNISQILKLSFHHLPSPSLKKCFAYCSIFSKGVCIRREELIELWMAEGFLQSSDMESLGNKYINLLLQNSLLQVGERDKHGNIKHCTMHDLVHDLADSISNVFYNDRFIRWKCNGDASSRIPVNKAKRCHALFYQGAISDITFSDFKSLHSLTLIGDDIDVLPSSIWELIHLRYLNISDTSISHLPDSIGDLCHLETMRISDFRFETDEFTSVMNLPSTLKYLFNLRHLYVCDQTKLPPHVGVLTSLRTLPYFEVGGKDGHWIVELERLNNLQGELEIVNLQKVRNVEESEKANLIQKSGIIRLELWWNMFPKGERNDEEVLQGLQPHPNLKMLRIVGFNGKSFPSWALRMAVFFEGNWVGLNNLIDIKLKRCECEDIPMLGHLPRLKSLVLSDLRNVTSIGTLFYRINSCRKTVIVFPALERLRLHKMRNLREWAEVEIPSDIKVFPRLKHLEIWGCNQLANICGFTLTSLARLDNYGLDELVCLPDWLFLNNQNLSELEIKDCPKLRKLPDGLHSLTSLRKLEIWKCNNLKPIPYFRVDSPCEVGLRSLRKLEISGSDCESLPEELQHLSALEYLSLEDLGIEELPEWIGNLSSLQKLLLRNCKQLRSLPEAMRRLTNLKELWLNDCPLLKARFNPQQSDDDDDFEWPKISHISSIYIDGRFTRRGGWGPGEINTTSHTDPRESDGSLEMSDSDSEYYDATEQ